MPTDAETTEPTIPSGPALFDAAARTITHADAFTPSEDQAAVLDLVRRLLTEPAYERGKNAVVITGGTGSGKSALALTLLGEAIRSGHRARHATGSQAFTTALRKIAGRGSTETQRLFQYFGTTAADTAPDTLDLLVCDDAHQLRATSNTRYTPAARRDDRAQVARLLDTARVAVFVLDEQQAVRPGQIGTREHIRAAADAYGVTMHTGRLDGQHRCRSPRYDTWVQRLLGLDGTQPPVPWTPEDSFELRVADSPQELEAMLRRRTEHGHTARITAGYCWPWSDATPRNPLADDIVIDHWRRPWSVKGNCAVNGLPPSPLWATDPAGAGQVGCIYTAQGFEYDYNGVILGPDLVWRDNRWITDTSATYDNALTRATASDYDEMIRRIYRVLLTRGRTGTILHSTDPTTLATLHKLIE